MSWFRVGDYVGDLSPMSRGIQGMLDNSLCRARPGVSNAPRSIHSNKRAHAHARDMSLSLDVNHHRDIIYTCTLI